MGTLGKSKDFSSLNNSSISYLESLYLEDEANSAPEQWGDFFKTGEKETAAHQGSVFTNDPKEVSVTKLIQAYRSRGHLKAEINPLGANDNLNDNGARKIEELELSYHGLSEGDLDKVFKASKELKIPGSSLRKIIAHLEGAYCSTLGIEFVHCNDNLVRRWIYDRLEPTAGEASFPDLKKREIFYQLCRASVFENFLQTKYIGQKRFGLEGGESLIPALNMMIKKGSHLGLREFVLGMAHRGRLNVLVNTFEKSYFHLFTEFEGGVLPEDVKGDGDVKYHLGQSTDIKINNEEIHLSLAFNPSHLEAVNPIVEGMVKAKCKKYYNSNQSKIVSVLIHGDAAVAGQGVNYELANMSRVRGYDNGGTIHIVINNQIGFTAGSNETRSSIYCTDLAKMTDSPIFHVNGDDVEKVVYVFELAIEFRQKFQTDVWIDLNCYRKRGHNESDEPRFTQPIMYEKISKKKSIYDIYLEKIIKENVYQTLEVNRISQDIKNSMEGEFDNAKKKKSNVEVSTLNRYWQSIRPSKQSDFLKSYPTKISLSKLNDLGVKIFEKPTQIKGIKLFSKLVKILEHRRKFFFQDKVVDWAMAEQLAYASLLSEGISVRLSGQDSVRGTFSHRHAFLKDVENESLYTPLQACLNKNATLRVLNSPLSEYSVLGFEYGYSLSRPHALVIWEAQFGDFANGAQIIIDQFITSAESKWQRRSGLTILLPHGYEGMGPEHSSARLERFLQCCAENNMYVVNATTPANFFHVLRRQVKSKFRIPLVIMSPKSLLRHPEVISDFGELTKGDFLEVIDDREVALEKCTKVIFCSGKIYYDLHHHRRVEKINDVALVRLEQLYPLSSDNLKQVIKKYAGVKQKLWVQEEPKNMGAWSHIQFYLGNLGLKCICRSISSSPASGMKRIHDANQKNVIQSAFEGN